MKKIDRFLIPASFLVAILTIVGCGKHGENGPKISSGPQEKHLRSLKENLALADVTCADKNDCPEAVAMVVINDEDPDGQKIRKCTGFLVDGQVMVTASQCIPNEVKADPNLCSRRIGVKFPALKSGPPAEEIACAKLLSATELTEAGRRDLNLPDVAFFQLKTKSQRKPFTISRGGIEPNQNHRAYVLEDAEGQALSGQIVKRECAPLRGSDRVPFYTSNESDVAPVFGKGCDFHDTELGAPLLTKDNHVIAVTYDVPEDVRTVNQSTLVMPDKVEPFGLVSNLYCLEVPAEVAAASRPLVSCGESEKDRRAANAKIDFERAYFQSTEDLIQKSYTKWVARSPRLFRYQTSLTLAMSPSVWSASPKIAGTAIPDFKCVRKSEWNRLRASKQMVRSNFTRARFTVSQGYDGYLRRLPRVTTRLLESQTFTLGPADGKALTFEFAGQRTTLSFCTSDLETAPDLVAVKTP